MHRTALPNVQFSNWKILRGIQMKNSMEIFQNVFVELISLIENILFREIRNEFNFLE